MVAMELPSDVRGLRDIADKLSQENTSPAHFDRLRIMSLAFVAPEGEGGGDGDRGDGDKGGGDKGDGDKGGDKGGQGDPDRQGGSSGPVKASPAPGGTNGGGNAASGVRG
jgi:hypothetical protein